MKSKLVKAYIIDDNRSSIDILKKMLEDNYSVEVIGTTTDAQDGLRGIEELSPDILFLDIEMPDISGLEVCSTLKDILSNDTKVVFYTGYNKYMLDAIRRQASTLSSSSANNASNTPLFAMATGPERALHG